MALYWIYRVNGGEVVGVARNDPTGNYNANYQAHVYNPSAPDGEDMNQPKIWTGTELRNATAQEISDFATYQAEDENLQQRIDAIEWLKNHSVVRKALKSAFEVVLEELNILRTEHSLPDRTLAQFLTAWENKVNAGDHD